MLNLKCNEQAAAVLETVALCGCYPVSALDLIPSKSSDYLRKTIRQMREERYLSMTGKGGLKALRLLKKGIAALDMLHPAAAAYYLDLTGNGTFSTERGIRSRMLRMAEAIELMHLSGAKTAAWDAAAGILQGIGPTRSCGRHAYFCSAVFLRLAGAETKRCGRNL